MMEVEHVLKLKEQFFEPIMSGDKSFEIRQDDRHFQKGDTVLFKLVSENGEQTAPLVEKSLTMPRYEITYVLHGWGLPPNICVFGIREMKAP